VGATESTWSSNKRPQRWLAARQGLSACFSVPRTGLQLVTHTPRSTSIEHDAAMLRYVCSRTRQYCGKLPPFASFLKAMFGINN